ncbi:MAG: acyl-CoA thioesterase [Lachnospiraceae bacterium]|jgi:acyl-CoA hydrolase
MEELQRKISDSVVETIHLVRPGDLNSVGRLFGGTLMMWIDEVAATVAKRHSHMEVTTLSIDKLLFMHGAYLNDTIVVSGKMVYVGNSSMLVRVETRVENIEGEQHVINEAYITLVGLDKMNKPSRVPRLLLETDEERAAWRDAEERKRKS